MERIECKRCNIYRQIKLGFADPKYSYAKSFERYILELSHHMTIHDNSKHPHISWGVIKDIQKRHLKKKFSRPRLKYLHSLAIDEITIKKGHRHLTVVLDLASGAVVFVGDVKGAEALIPFWKKLAYSVTQIQAVAIDKFPAYIEAVSSRLPGASIVNDRFHVIKLYNDKLSDLRRDLHGEAADQHKKDVLKSTRWLLMKNPENLDNAKKEKEHLEEDLKLNQPLYTAYYMKEELHRVWMQESKGGAKKKMDEWIKKAQCSGIRMLTGMTKTLASRKSGILACYGNLMSTGLLEGTNNKIKTIKRQAYGFRDMEFFKLKIMGLHDTR
jgi:transposase